MRCLIILLILFSYYSLIKSRPSQPQEENDSEIGGNEYESDDSVDDEYLEEREPTMDEVPRKPINLNGVIKDSENQELIQDAKFTPNKRFNNNNKDYDEAFTENESSIRKEVEKKNPNDLSYRGESLSFVKEDPNYILGTNNAAEPERSSLTDYQKSRVECKNVDERSTQLASDYSANIFKRYHDPINKDKSDYTVDAKEQSYLKKQYDNRRPLNNKALKNYDYTFYVDRNRRQVKSLEEYPVRNINSMQSDNNNLDISNENAVLKNIKKLSDQDLEDLLNSLPEDKKSLLKKIMDKREITKKASAIEDNNYLDQSDTSKIEGSYSVNANSVSPLSDSGTTETSKGVESAEEPKTKNLDNVSESGKMESKSGETSDTTTEGRLDVADTGSKNEANINSNTKETSKIENKREVNQKDFIDENIALQNSIYNGLNIKTSNDYPIDKGTFENEDWCDTKNEDLIAEKREDSQNDPSDLSASIEKLEDSFPSANAYGDTESELEPLVRNKRTELYHRVKKRDLPFLPIDNVSFITNFENESSENVERSEFNNDGPLCDQYNNVKNSLKDMNDLTL